MKNYHIPSVPVIAITILGFIGLSFLSDHYLITIRAALTLGIFLRRA